MNKQYGEDQESVQAELNYL